MRFAELFGAWQESRLTQQEAAQVLGVCERSFRRYALRFEDEGLEGLIDRRLGQVSHRRAPVDEVMALAELYRARYAGWNVRHFHSWYRREHEGARSYSWVKKELQAQGLVERSARRGAHRKRRECTPLAGMMVHQDGSRHGWVVQALWDLIVTMDDATNEHYSMFFVEEEGTASSFRGVGEVIASHGLFASFYSDRGSHYWYSPEAGGKVDKTRAHAIWPCDGAAWHPDDCGLLAPGARAQRAGLSYPSGAAAQGARRGGHHRHGSGQSVSARGVPARLQCRVRAPLA